jgi:hypothetical protein
MKKPMIARPAEVVAIMGKYGNPDFVGLAAGVDCPVTSCCVPNTFSNTLLACT